MNLLDKVQHLANKSRETENYKLAAILRSIATDLALIESHRYMKARFISAKIEADEIKADLKKMHMYKLADELDVIARDLESKIIQFSAEDPIEAVLSSYSLIHKIARTESQPNNFQEILEIANNEDLSDDEIAHEIKKMTLGLPLNDKKNISYILEKDYNISIPLEKIATFGEPEEEMIENPKSKEQIEHNRRIVKEKVKKMQEVPTNNKDKWMESFPSSPSIWSGFAYEAIVPYQQSSQLNYWSLASKETEMLRKIANTPSTEHTIVHLRDDLENQRTRILRRLVADRELLKEGLVALSRDPPLVKVMIDHAARVAESLEKEIDKLQAEDPRVQK